MPTLCDFHIDIGSDPWLDMLYEAPSREDGYFRDGCVFREEIDIPDTMSAAILYENGVQVSYSLNTFMPIEGYHLAFNGTRGRIEIRQYERQAWETPDEDEILVMRNFGTSSASACARSGRAFRRRSGAAEDALCARGTTGSARAAGGGARRRDVGARGVAAMESVRLGAPVKVRPLLEQPSPRGEKERVVSK